MKLHKLNPIGGIAVSLLGTGLGLVGYFYGAAMPSSHAIEPGHAYALLGYGCGLVGALVGVACSKWFHAVGQ